jgi:hypothetical protein
MKEVGPWHAWKILSNQTRPPIRVPGEHKGPNLQKLFKLKQCLTLIMLGQGLYTQHMEPAFV